MKMIVMITEASKIIQKLVKLVKTGRLKHLIHILEPLKIIQLLVLVIITTAEILMDLLDNGVILLIRIRDGSIVIH